MTTQELTTLEDSAMHISMWKGSFADNYQKYPRLYRALTENEVYICKDGDILRICFYVKYDVQKQCIQERFYDDFISNLRLLFGIETIDLEIIVGVDLPF